MIVKVSRYFLRSSSFSAAEKSLAYANNPTKSSAEVMTKSINMLINGAISISKITMETESPCVVHLFDFNSFAPMINRPLSGFEPTFKQFQMLSIAFLICLITVF